MELQLILINNQALCLYRSTLNGPVTTLKLRGEPINTVEFPSEYLERVCSQLGGVSLSQLTVSLTHDQVNEQTLRNWGMALVCAERLNIGRLRARLPRPISPHEQLELTEEGISCLSGSSRQALMSFEALGTTMSPSAPLALPSQVEAPVVSGPHPEVLERLEALETKLSSFEPYIFQENPNKDIFRSPVFITGFIYPSRIDLPYEYRMSLTKQLKNGDEVKSRDIIIEMLPKQSVYITSPSPGYIYYLFDDIDTHQNYIPKGIMFKAIAVISSSPEDTLPEIRSWLSKNNIPFYQGPTDLV